MNFTRRFCPSWFALCYPESHFFVLSVSLSLFIGRVVTLRKHHCISSGNIVWKVLFLGKLIWRVFICGVYLFLDLLLWVFPVMNGCIYFLWSIDNAIYYIGLLILSFAVILLGLLVLVGTWACKLQCSDRLLSTMTRHWIYRFYDWLPMALDDGLIADLWDLEGFVLYSPAVGLW